MCVLSIKVSIRKKSWNLLYAPRNSQNLTTAPCLHTVLCISPIYRSLSVATSPVQKWPVSKGNERTLRIPWISMVEASFCYILTFWPGQKCHSKVMHRKEVTHSNGSYERTSCGRKLADKMGLAKKNSHGTLIDWCTGREWPLNCIIVISAWWRLNIRFQRSSGCRTII